MYIPGIIRFAAYCTTAVTYDTTRLPDRALVQPAEVRSAARLFGGRSKLTPGFVAFYLHTDNIPGMHEYTRRTYAGRTPLIYL